MKFSTSLFAFTIASLSPLSASATDALQGCYKPVRGYAASICTAPDCSTQSGFYRVVLRNPTAPFGQRKKIVRGSFNGTTTGITTECPLGLGLTLNHELQERNHGGTLQTQNDIACGQDGSLVPPPPPPVKIIEEFQFVSGTGAFAGLRPGSSLILEGTLGASGFNTFTVPRNQGRTVCFD